MKYSLVRIGVFALAFGVMFAVGVIWWLAAILAAVISLCVAYIFFRGMRDALTADFAQRRARPAATDPDASAEDAADTTADSAANSAADTTADSAANSAADNAANSAADNAADTVAKKRSD